MIWNSKSFVICGFKSTKRCKFTWNTVRAWHILLQFYISPSQWPFNQRCGTAGTSRLLWISYILCLAITWISTEWNLNQLVSIYCTFSFTYIICYGTQSIHHHITPQTVLNEVIYTAWSKNNLHTSKTSIVWSY